MNTHVKFEIAKLLKEKGFDNTTLRFYTKPNTKMFGIDEHGRYYPMKNKAKSLWTMGNAAALKIENVYQAPTIAEVVMWLYEKHGVWVDVSLNQFSKPTDLQWMYSIVFTQRCTYSHSPKSYNSPTEAYEAAILHVLNNLI